MHLHDTIAGQLESVGLPLFAVTLSSLPCADTPLLLMLHWHGFRHEPVHPGSAPGQPLPVPVTALQLAHRWSSFAALEETVLDAAWQLGAWSLERNERRGCNTVGASEREALACRQAFGDFPRLDEVETLIEEAPDRQELMHLAADLGYVCWQFRPVAGGFWAAFDGDDTLSADGRREPPCPVLPRARGGARASSTVYRFGRVERLIR